MISLKKLLKEQAPALMPDPLAAGGPPMDQTPTAPDVSQSQEPEESPEEKPDEEGPAPTNANEYDFTQDFQAFENETNKAKNDAKKEFIEKMAPKVVGKKVTVNASRGYGQPQKDYEIEKVKKATVDWYYNKNIVVFTDENGKEYFLTPGVDVKIEGAPAPEPESEPQKDVTAAPPTPPGQEVPPAAPGGPEIPMTPAPAGGDVGLGAGEPDMSMSTAAPAPAPTGAPTPPAAPVPPEEDPLQPKKIQEWSRKKIQADAESFLIEYMAGHVKDPITDLVDFTQYIKKSSLKEGKSHTIVNYTLEIPRSHMVYPLDSRDIQLTAVNAFRSNNGRFGNNIKKSGTVNISKIGRNYLFEITKETSK